MGTVSSGTLGAYPSGACDSPLHAVVVDAAMGAANGIDVPIDDPNPDSVAWHTHGGTG